MAGNRLDMILYFIQTADLEIGSIRINVGYIAHLCKGLQGFSESNVIVSREITLGMIYRQFIVDYSSSKFPRCTTKHYCLMFSR